MRRVYRTIYRTTHISLAGKAMANPERQAWTGDMTSRVQRKASGYEIPGGWFAGLGTWVRQLGFQNCYDFFILHLYWHFKIQISECLLPVCWMWTVLRIGHFPFGFESPRERGTNLKELHWRTVLKDSHGASSTETELRWFLNFKPSSSGSSFSSALRVFFK